MCLLILEDDPKDSLLAADAARAEGFEDIEVFTSLPPAIERIEQALNGEKNVPDALLVDLSVGSESGYELLRLWHRTGRAKVHVIVWSCLEERNREICALFKVDTYVPKWEGQAALRKALKQVIFTKC